MNFRKFYREGCTDILILPGRCARDSISVNDSTVLSIPSSCTNVALNLILSGKKKKKECG